MLPDEELINVKVFEAVFEEDKPFSMMSHEKNGVNYITFAIEGSDGLWIPGPFPTHLVECEDCLTDLATGLREEGFVLTQTPEQMIRVS